MNRTAIVSDVHGNAVALRAVFAELDEDGIDRAVCLGDVIQGGPEPEVCVDLLADREWPVVLGNADAFVLDPSSAEGSIPRSARVFAATSAANRMACRWERLPCHLENGVLQ